MATTDSSSSSRPSLAVITVCSIVGALVALFALYRLVLYIHRRRVLKSLPLPPIQPLAHHREKYMPAPSSSLRVPVEPSYLRPSPSQPSLAASSTAPLISPSSAPSLNDLSLRQGHFSEEIVSPVGMQDMPLTPLSAEPLETDQLVPPNPAFAANTPSQSSSRSASPFTASSSQSAEESDSGVASRGRPSIQEQRARAASSSRRPRRHSATPSTLSGYTNNTVHTTRSSRSISTIRGAPHLPHNRIEIVLPAPLAPESHPYGFNHSQTTRPLVDLTSIRDTWLPTASRGTESHPISSHIRSRGRPSESAAAPRPSRSSSSNHGHSPIHQPSPLYPPKTTWRSTSDSAYPPNSHSPASRSSSSNLSQATGAAIEAQKGLPTPPVPRLPSIYDNTRDSGISP